MLILFWKYQHITFQNPIIIYKYSLQLNFSEYLILNFNYRFCSFYRDPGIFMLFNLQIRNRIFLLMIS